MTKAIIHFKDETPDYEINHLTRVTFEGDQSRWYFLEKRRDGRTSVAFSVSQIAYVELAG